MTAPELAGGLLIVEPSPPPLAQSAQGGMGGDHWTSLALRTGKLCTCFCAVFTFPEMRSDSLTLWCTVRVAPPQTDMILDLKAADTMYHLPGRDYNDFSPPPDRSQVSISVIAACPCLVFAFCCACKCYTMH